MLNPPMVAKGLFTIVSNLLLPKKIRQRAHFIKSIEEVYNIVDREKLLCEHGGDLNFDMSNWVEIHKKREVNGTIESFKTCFYASTKIS